MDFYKIKERPAKIDGVAILEIYPDFQVLRTKDLMLRGKSFYAVWDETVGLWSTDEYDVQRLVDADLKAYADERRTGTTVPMVVKYLGDWSTGSWKQFRTYLSNLSDSSHQLDDHLTFANTEVHKGDYVSKRLPYPLEAGDTAAWDELVSTLYDEEERRKIEWMIGAVVSGDSARIQKFGVFHGGPGTGKSTILNIIQSLFAGYTCTFEAKALTSNNGTFAMSSFASNPLVAVQHDGDLSKIEDNTKLNSIISHEWMEMNEKYKPPYDVRINAFLFMGTNKPVKISDGKSGIIRRLIDIHPTGDKLAPRRYQAIMGQIEFQLGAIAHHCLEVYRELGRDYYEGYRPVEMMLSTDIFYNFIEAYFDVFKEQDGETLVRGYDLYKQFCSDSNIEHVMPRHKFRDEFHNYFENFEERAIVDGERVRSWYSGFIADKFKSQVNVDEQVYSLVMEESASLLDDLLAGCPAQYASGANEDPRFHEIPSKKWEKVTTTLSDLDTSKLHYVKPPVDHIVIDFDLRGDDGEKSAERNLEAASRWPPTYSEYSKGGGGVHLHYRWTGGDPADLARVYEDGIEVKVFTGDSSLRRRVSRANNVPVADLGSGLSIRDKKVISEETIKSEKGLRDLIERNLRKEIHASTKPSIDFIDKILKEAYDSGMTYDVTDLRNKIFVFANGSSNQALYCIKVTQDMRFASEPKEIPETFLAKPKDERLVFFDVEVFPNLFIICWKYEGDGKVVRMINPTARQVEEIMHYKLVGFNCRRYDNHILYGAYMGYSPARLYELSQKIINNVPGAGFREAYNISYADIYDYASKKQGLKKWQIELGILHLESALPWDQPVPEKLWNCVADYCENDVLSTESTFEATKGDFVARQILADLSGLPINSSTQAHTAKIVFGEDRNPHKDFVYTDLSEEFPGYEFDKGKSHYRGEVTGEGGYVYAEPGMYENVALLDIASMHPTTIERLNLFGTHTKHYSALKEARLAIKRNDYEAARKMFGGRLVNHLESEEGAEALSYALKIVINIVYGLTSARFDNMFKDPRNIDNIVAKRGALFMINLKHYVQEMGFTVAHIKTDSIKIPDATPEIIKRITEYGAEYGYTFEHEATYEKLCLVNQAVYIAKGKKGWTAVGAEFAHPYVYKTLFSGEDLVFKDFCETKTVTTALYLDFENGEEPRFVGKAGQFVPVTEGGGKLMRKSTEGNFHSASGAKGFLWQEAAVVLARKMEDVVDIDYFEGLVYEAKEQIGKFGDPEQFLD